MGTLDGVGTMKRVEAVGVGRGRETRLAASLCGAHRAKRSGRVSVQHDSAVSRVADAVAELGFTLNLHLRCCVQTWQAASRRLWFKWLS